VYIKPGMPGRRRRRHSEEFKLKVAEECRRPGVSIASVALANGLNANLLRKWVAEREAAGLPPRALAPVRAPTEEFVALPVVATPKPAEGSDIRIELRRGAMTVTDQLEAYAVRNKQPLKRNKAVIRPSDHLNEPTWSSAQSFFRWCLMRRLRLFRRTGWQGIDEISLNVGSNHLSKVVHSIHGTKGIAGKLSTELLRSRPWHIQELCCSDYSQLLSLPHMPRQQSQSAQ